MSVVQWIVGILLMISAIVMIVSVLMQSSERTGLGAVSGAAETFFGKSKARGMNAKLALITKICTACSSA
jgi:preprotein translocase subunit SecG